MGPDVEEGGARPRGGLEVDAQVAPLPTRRHVDRRLHLSQTQKRGLFIAVLLSSDGKSRSFFLIDIEGQFAAQGIDIPDPITMRLVSRYECGPMETKRRRYI